tara:strand:- start:708 stop:947 length:240 start_codon:yes stop_codon:yes gene_type:complete
MSLETSMDYESYSHTKLIEIIHAQEKQIASMRKGYATIAKDMIEVKTNYNRLRGLNAELCVQNGIYRELLEKERAKNAQ